MSTSSKKQEPAVTCGKIAPTPLYAVVEDDHWSRRGEDVKRKTKEEGVKKEMKRAVGTASTNKGG